MSLPVLIVLHQEHSTPGRVGNALGAAASPSTFAARASAILCPTHWRTTSAP